MARVDEVCPMLPPQLIVAGIIAVASAATGFGVAWQIQSWRADSEEKDRVEATLENQRLIGATRTRNDQAVINAVNNGVARSTALRRDSDSARAAADSLRDEITRTVRDASASLAACTVRTAALGELCAAATESHRQLAEKADRHASDIRTIIEAWPK